MTSTRVGTSTVQRLRDGAAPELDKITGHPWAVAMAGGTLEARPYRDWLEQCAWFCEMEGKALNALLRYGPPAKLFRIYGALIADTIREPEELRDELATLTGAAAGAGASPAWPITTSYGLYMQAAADAGPFAGAAAIAGAEISYFETFTALRSSASPGDRYWARIDNWSGDRFAELVADLSSAIDEMTAGASLAVIDEMASTFRQVVAFEADLWTALWRGRRRP
jgi:thiaminase